MSNALDCRVTNTTKVIETEHHMLLMTNLYKKENLTPVSMQGMVPWVNIGYSTFNIKTHMTLNTTYRAEWRHHDFGVVKDPYIENRYYILLNSQHSNVNNNYPYLSFINDDGQDVSIIRNVQIQYMTWEKIVDIDETYLYVIARYFNNNNAYLYRINKHTGSTHEFFHTGDRRNVSNLIHKDETYLYFVTRVNYTTWYFTRLNKSTAEVKNKAITAPTRTYVDSSGTPVNYLHNSGGLWMSGNCITNENFYYENGKYYWIMPQKNGNAFPGEGNANNNLIALCYDTKRSFEDSDVVTFKEINIQDNKELTWLELNGYMLYRSWVKNGYLYYTIYDETNNYTQAIPVQGIHKFKIKPGFNLEWESVERINTDKQIISMVFNSDRSRILVGYNQSFDVLRYNENTGDYELTNKEVVQVSCAGFDSLDRIWYMTTDYGVHVQNADDPQEVIMEFEHNHYTYAGSNILTYLTFEAKSFSNEVPLGKYILRLTGNARFKDTQSQKLEFQYSGGIRKFEFEVTGPKRITCSAEFIKEW